MTDYERNTVETTMTAADARKLTAQAIRKAEPDPTVAAMLKHAESQIEYAARERRTFVDDPACAHCLTCTPEQRTLVYDVLRERGFRVVPATGTGRVRVEW